LPRTDLRAVVQRAPWLLTQEVRPIAAGVMGQARLLNGFEHALALCTSDQGISLSTW